MNWIIEEILIERGKQKEKWGEQNHPSITRVLMERPGGCDAERMCEDYEILCASRAKFLTNNHHKRGIVTFGHILIEEVAEAIEAAVIDYPNESSLRAELIQVAAVVIQWIECIDRHASENTTAALKARQAEGLPDQAKKEPQ